MSWPMIKSLVLACFAPGAFAEQNFRLAPSHCPAPGTRVPFLTGVTSLTILRLRAAIAEGLAVIRRPTVSRTQDLAHVPGKSDRSPTCVLA